MTRSPSGKLAVPSEGPLDAKILVIGESPVVGRAGRMLDRLLSAASLQRTDLRLVNAVPCRAPNDRFADHDPRDLAWGLELLTQELVQSQAKLIMPLGNNPLALLCQNLPHPPRYGGDEKDHEKSKIGAWRGSLFPLAEPMNTLASYERSTRPQQGQYVLPSYHPAAVARQYSWHHQSIRDFKRAKRFLDGEWEWPRQRKWFVNDYAALPHFVDQVLNHEHLVAVDSEQDPYYIIALVSEAEVHVFEWRPDLTELLSKLFSSEWVLKCAHNAPHDLTFLKQLGVDVKPPYVDTMGLAHVLNHALPRNISPGLSVRFTSWPYHKWLRNVDPRYYCGYDTVVCYDSYWAAQREIVAEDLLAVSDHDHALLEHCLKMQWAGVLIDDRARRCAESAAQHEAEVCEEKIKQLAQPVIEAKLTRFKRPHLFWAEKRCECCGGGSVARQHCWRCGGLPAKPKKRADYQPRGKETVKQLREALPPCERCAATGKVGTWLDWRIDGPASNDVLYRGFGLRARRYKGSETRRAAQLADLLPKATPAAQEILRLYLDWSKANAELNEMKQCRPDFDGRLHSQFDPWGTASGRVASKASLLQRGRNMQNIPLKYRNIIVSDPGRLFVAPDMAQIEARCVAVLSRDDAYWKAFTEPVNWPENAKHGLVDSHTAIQKRFHDRGLFLSRAQVKRVVYALTYGGQDEQLAVELTSDYNRTKQGVAVTPEDMAWFRTFFYSEFPGVKTWQTQVLQEVSKTRCLHSPTGRRFWWLGYITQTVATLRPTDFVIQEVQRGKRRLYQILSREVQKKVWSRQPQDMAAWLLAEGLQCLTNPMIQPRLQIHDELVLQIPGSPTSVVEACLTEIKEALTLEKWGMIFPCDLGKPALNWKEAKGG